MARVLTIRRSLMRSFVLLVLVVAGALLTLMTVHASQEVEALSRGLVQRATVRVRGELQGFFRPVTAQLEAMAEWRRRGVLSDDRRERIELLRPVLASEPQVSSLMVADADGAGFMLLEEPEGFRARTVGPDHPGEARWVTVASSGEVTRRWSEPLDYDPRTRPWYAAAQNSESRVAWTQPYSFFTTKDPGITASMRVEGSGVAGASADAGARPTGVVALDVMLADISRFTTGLQVSPHGQALVLAEDGRVVGLPHTVDLEDEAAMRAALLEDMDSLGLQAASAAWAQADRSPGVFVLEHEGAPIWVGLEAFALGPDLHLWTLVLVPERDLLGPIQRRRNVAILLVFGVLAGAVLVSLRLAAAYSRPLERLADEAERIRTLDLEARPRARSRLAEVEQLGEAQERMRAALESFSRYVPVGVVRELFRRGEVAKLGGKSAELSMLFTDIEGFTSVSEGMTPDAVTEHVGAYFDAMLGALSRHGATIDKLIGDAIMAFWGAPVENEAHARNALEAVLSARDELSRLHEQWEEEGRPLLHTRFGLHTGRVMVGNVGSRDRLNYTALGDAVNLASRLEGANKAYGTRVLASRDFVEAVGLGYVWRWVDRVAVKGRSAAVDVFEVLGREGEVEPSALAFKAQYEAAFAAMRDRNFDRAIEGFSALAPEPSAVLMRGRCEAWQREPPPDTWQGESRLSSK